MSTEILKRLSRRTLGMPSLIHYGCDSGPWFHGVISPEFLDFLRYKRTAVLVEKLSESNYFVHISFKFRSAATLSPPLPPLIGDHVGIDIVALFLWGGLRQQSPNFELINLCCFQES